MINLSTQYAGLTLRNPLIAASSGLTASINKLKELEDAGIGAVVLKSLFEEQIAMSSDELLQQSDYPEAADYLQQYVEAEHINKYLDLIKEAKEELSIPIIASVNCYKSTAWIKFAEQIEQAGADALELNIMRIETDIDTPADALEKAAVEIVEKISAIISIPVIVKISKFLNNVPRMVDKLKNHGAKAVVLFNRPYQPDINIEKEEMSANHIFSVPSDLTETLRMTAIVSHRVSDIDIASSTGVHSWESAVKCLLAGATTIQLCSLLYLEGLGAVSEILTCIEEWMKNHHYNSLEEFRGRLGGESDPAVYERLQFMKYLSNHK